MAGYSRGAHSINFSIVLLESLVPARGKIRQGFGRVSSALRYEQIIAISTCNGHLNLQDGTHLTSQVILQLRLVM